jgi:nucleoside-diphosphate-sugar epimerase
VFHLAAAVGVFLIQGRTLDSMTANIRGTENVVAAASRHGAKILFASTSEVYGKNTKIGLREDDDRITGSPLKSRWSYAEAKAIDESLVSAYVNERGLQAVIVRLFNTVGPRQTGHYGMVIPKFVQQALAGEALTVSIEALAQRVIRLTGSASVTTGVSYLAAYGPGYEDMERRIPDCSFARELVGFSPGHSLDDIIQSVSDYYKAES